MEKQPPKLKNKPVKASESELLEKFMADLKHPLKDEINQVRSIIKSADPQLKERIKWNAPSYYHQADLVTFHLRPLDKVHLVFHNIAIVKVKSDLLEGAYKDRRMMYFSGTNDIHLKQAELLRIIKEYIHLAAQNEAG